LLRSQRHHLTLSFPLEPHWLVADPDCLETILVLLLDNAARYTPPGGQIGLRAEGQQDRVAFQVQDSGQGLDAGKMAEALALSAQARHFSVSSAEGLGLGLALARSLVEAHGGTLTAASDGPGRGSQFALHLPARQEAALAA